MRGVVQWSGPVRVTACPIAALVQQKCHYLGCSGLVVHDRRPVQRSAEHVVQAGELTAFSADLEMPTLLIHDHFNSLQ